MPDLFAPQDTPDTNKTSTTNDAENPVVVEKPRTPQANATLSKQENHIHALASFCENPVGMRFESQDDDETILLFLRRHPATNTPWIISSILFILIPPLLFSLSPVIFVNNPISSQLPTPYISVLLAFYYLIIFAFIFVNFIDWFYNVSLVTNKRIVDIDFSDIVYHNVAATKIDLIEDVDYTQTGFIRGLLDFGDVEVQTAAEKTLFDFTAIPKPARVVGIIEDMIGKGGAE